MVCVYHGSVHEVCAMGSVHGACVPVDVHSGNCLKNGCPAKAEEPQPPLRFDCRCARGTITVSGVAECQNCRVIITIHRQFRMWPSAP